MINERLKKIIFKKLYMDLSKSEVISFRNSIWVINREKKYWYLEYKQNGTLFWRHDFFDHFFFMFSLKENVYEPLICEFVEQFLNCMITSSIVWPREQVDVVDEALNCKIKFPTWAINQEQKDVDEVLNCKVNSSEGLPFEWSILMEKMFDL
jgi:hypothetical protein